MRRMAVLPFATLLAGPVATQDAHPNRTITLITPYAPGGGSDFLTRTLAEALKTRLN